MDFAAEQKRLEANVLTLQSNLTSYMQGRKQLKGQIRETELQIRANQGALEQNQRLRAMQAEEDAKQKEAEPDKAPEAATNLAGANGNPQAKTPREKPRGRPAKPEPGAVMDEALAAARERAMDVELQAEDPELHVGEPV